MIRESHWSLLLRQVVRCRVSLAIGAVMFLAATANAQRPGAGPGRPPGGFPMPPGFNLMKALDVNQDGKVSATEIDNAVAALQKLDTDKDGKLSGKEIGWPPSFGGGGRGFPGPGGRGFPGFPGSEGAGPARRPDPENEGAQRPNDAPPDNAPRRNSFFSAEQLKRLDRNDDGKITKDEIPKRMQSLILGRADINKNGAVEADELEKLTDKKPAGKKE